MRPAGPPTSGPTCWPEFRHRDCAPTGCDRVALGRSRRIAEHQGPLCRRRWRQSQARTGHAASLRRSAAPTSLRCSVPWPRRQLTSRTACAAFRQSRRSQFTRRAARAGHEPCAPRRPRGASQPARARLCGSVGGLRGSATCAATRRIRARKRLFSSARDAPTTAAEQNRMAVSRAPGSPAPGRSCATVVRPWPSGRAAAG
jgi:hypothetical protein